jgi:hypothetical protein
MASWLIQEQYQTDPTVKWKILNEVRKTRTIDISKLSLKDNILYYDTKALDTPWALIAHFLPAYHKNQTRNLSSTLFETMSHIDFFKRIKRNQQMQVIQGFTSILSALYSIYNTPKDAITWTLALGTIVTTILMIVSMCASKKLFRKMKSVLAFMDLEPDKIQDILGTVIAGIDDQYSEPTETIQCQHNVERLITRLEYSKMSGQFIVHEEGRESRIEGIGRHAGCVVLKPGDDEVILYAVDKNQGSSNLLGPSFTAILSLIYILGIAGFTHAGYANVKELLDLSRLKNEMKTSVKDMKDFIQFIAGDLCDIDLLGDKTLLKSLNDQVILNLQLAELKPVAFVKD